MCTAQRFDPLSFVLARILSLSAPVFGVGRELLALVHSAGPRTDSGDCAKLLPLMMAGQVDRFYVTETTLLDLLSRQIGRAAAGGDAGVRCARLKQGNGAQ